MSKSEAPRTLLPVPAGSLDASTRWGRDAGRYSSRNTSKGALLQEARTVLRAIGEGSAIADVRRRCLNGQLLRKASGETRNRIWDALNWRYLAWDPPGWLLADLGSAAREDGASRTFVGLLYLHYARRDRLTFDLVTERLWQAWRDRSLEVGRDDVLDFLADCGGEQPQVRRWREGTRRKLAGSVLSALRDFGLLRGVRRKLLQRPAVAPEVVLHLCRLLSAEGLRGRTVLEAPDWRLFLWDPTDASFALGQLARRGEIRFEGSGRTVVLEVPPHPLKG